MIEFARLRELMVEFQIARRGIRDGRVLDAMREVPREAFIDPGYQKFAYEDSPLPIGEKQTISQPFIVAMMIASAEIKSGDRVLEVGAGSGYAAAVLSRIADKVYAVERHSSLADGARQRLAEIGYGNVEIRSGDGTKGWPEAAPFDAILVAAGARRVPEPLKQQLAVGGRLIIPVGEAEQRQTLRRITRHSKEAFGEEDLGSVLFVPIIGNDEPNNGQLMTSR